MANEEQPRAPNTYRLNTLQRMSEQLRLLMGHAQIIGPDYPADLIVRLAAGLSGAQGAVVEMILTEQRRGRGVRLP